MKVLILDAGGQYTKLIDRNIREAEVETVIAPLKEIVDHASYEAFLKEDLLNIKGIVISGGPGSVVEKEAGYRFLYELNIPILGICFGMQMIFKNFGGTVSQIAGLREDGVYTMNLINSNSLFKDTKNHQKVLLTHMDTCVSIPDDSGISIDGVTDTGKVIVAISHKSLPIYAVQFHPEVRLTECGRDIFRNFLFDICRLEPTYRINNRLESLIDSTAAFIIKTWADDYRLLSLVSGGVDSLVSTLIVKKGLERALNKVNDPRYKIRIRPDFDPAKYLLCVHIDHGFMRLNESDTIKAQLKKAGIDLIVMSVAHEFAAAHTTISITQNTNTNTNTNTNGSLEKKTVRVGPLACMTEPETKRKIIGDTFVAVLDKLKNVDKRAADIDSKKLVLIQGTLRPDLIESANALVSTAADTIKTHHNDTNLIRELREQGLVYEPLKDFHKDEVRQLARELGVDEFFSKRHPFPGPGLAIRTICNDRKGDLLDVDWVLLNQKTIDYMLNYKMNKSKKITNVRFDEIVKYKMPDSQLALLEELTDNQFRLRGIILPIKTVGVQGDCRSYHHPLLLATDAATPISDINWEALQKLTSHFLTKYFSFVNRVVVLIGPDSASVDQEVILRLSHCTLSLEKLDLLRRVDFIVNEALAQFGCVDKVSQFPVILTPVNVNKGDSLENELVRFSVVLRPFISDDFMTGLASLPGAELCFSFYESVCKKIFESEPQISAVLLDITGKPPGTTEWE